MELDEQGNSSGAKVTRALRLDDSLVMFGHCQTGGNTYAEQRVSDRLAGRVRSSVASFWQETCALVSSRF